MMRQKGLRILIVLLMLGILGVCGRKADKNSLLINQVKMYEAYHDLLMNLHDKGEFWEGGVAPLESAFGSIEENRYAICDVDLDHKDELILIYDTDCSGSVVEVVYDFDYAKRDIRHEVGFYSSAKFYNNGVLCVNISHNQGVAGRFWPFTVYMHDKKTDSYKRAVFIDAWDKEYAPVNGKGEEFPDDVDKDGNGMIYYIEDLSADEEEDDGNIEEAAAIDDAAYQEWWDSLMDGAKEIEIPFVNLTTDNIDKIKY